MTKKNIKGMRDNRWYLNIMSPNTKGEKFAWLDPTSIYINTNAFIDLLDDLLDDLEEFDCDVVAGIDAMGFVLGSKIWFIFIWEHISKHFSKQMCKIKFLP